MLDLVQNAAAYFDLTGTALEYACVGVVGACFTILACICA